MHEYNNHPIYGIAVPGTGKSWYSRGLIFDRDDKVTELKRLECSEINFATKLKAEAQGIKLCKDWIDAQRVDTESNRAASTPPL